MTTHFPTVPVEAAPREASFHNCEKLRPVALIVDDEPIITETLAAILNANGLAAITAINGLEALETALVIPPQILITDLAMPGMNGLDLAIEITRSVPDCEIIISSGHASGADLLDRMHALGCNFTTLMKPVHPADLLDQVFKMLQRRDDGFIPSQSFRSPSLLDFLASTRRQLDVYSGWNMTTRQRIRTGDLLA